GYETHPLWPTTESPQRREHRQIRFSGAIVLQALAPHQPHALQRRGLLQEDIHQSRLATTRLSRHKDDPPLSTHGLSQHPVHPPEIRLPPHQPHRTARYRSWTRGRSLFILVLS